MPAKTYASVMPTVAEALLPSATLSTDAILIGAMSLLIALCAQVEIPLSFTPVPLSGATLAVLYAGALLGARRGLAAVLLYLLEGSCGLPFFAGAAAGGVHLVGPSGGYLLGFAPAAWLTGILAERGWGRNPGSSLAMMVVGSAVILGLGLFGLSRYVPTRQLLFLGYYPFIIGDLAKSCIAAALLPLGWKFLEKLGAVSTD